MDGEIIWENWRPFKAEYNINGTSMKALVKEATPFLVSRARKNEKKSNVDDRERAVYFHFLERKKILKFEGYARFCTIDPKSMVFGIYDNHLTRATVREDPRGPLFATLDFKGNLGAWKDGTMDNSFYESFYVAFKKHFSLAILEPNV